MRSPEKGLETIKFKAKITDALIDSIPLAQTQAEADATFSALMLRMASGETIRG